MSGGASNVGALVVLGLLLVALIALWISQERL